jgi:hypothetical protein
MYNFIRENLFLFIVVVPCSAITFMGFHSCFAEIEKSQILIKSCHKSCHPYDINLSQTTFSNECYCDKSKRLYKADELLKD